jgi:hypothetical protein
MQISTSTISQQGPSLKRQKKGTYDDQLLQSTFGNRAMNNVVVNNNYKSDPLHENYFKFLRQNFVMKLNLGSVVSCFRSMNSAVALFNVRVEDVDVLNNLLLFLVEKLGIDKAKNIMKPLEKNETLFFKTDRFTAYFNHNNEKIQTLPKVAFEGNVAIKVMGLHFYKNKLQATVNEEEEEEEEYIVKLLIHLEQVRVLDDERTMEEKNECMFATN